MSLLCQRCDLFLSDPNFRISTSLRAHLQLKVPINLHFDFSLLLWPKKPINLRFAFHTAVAANQPVTGCAVKERTDSGWWYVSCLPIKALLLAYITGKKRWVMLRRLCWKYCTHVKRRYVIRNDSTCYTIKLIVTKKKKQTYSPYFVLL